MKNSIKVIEPRIDYTDGENCLNISIANILKFKGVQHYDKVWKQCGLNYIKPFNNYFGKLEARYMPFDEELKFLNNIHMVRKIETNIDVFFEEVRHLVDQNEPVLIYVDVFELEYNMFYKSRHSLHCITITGYNDKSFTFVDDLYNYMGNISYSSLIKAIEFNYGWPYENEIKPTYIYFPKSDYIEIDDNSIIKIMKENNNVLNGNVDKIDMQNRIIMVSNLPKDSITYLGINSIDQFIKDYSQLLDKQELLTTDLFDFLYRSFSEISGVRYLLSEFLKQSSQQEIKENLSKMYFELGQGWKICANMMIKGRVKKQEQMLERMLNRVHEIKVLERKALIYSERLCMLKNVT